MSTTESKVVNLSKKQARKQSPADKLLKFKRGLDELAPLVSDRPDLSRDVMTLRDRVLDEYIALERKFSSLKGA